MGTSFSVTGGEGFLRCKYEPLSPLKHPAVVLKYLESVLIGLIVS